MSSHYVTRVMWSPLLALSHSATVTLSGRYSNHPFPMHIHVHIHRCVYMYAHTHTHVHTHERDRETERH
jgi:hypothetical protein